MSNVNELVVHYIAAWNGPSAERRRDLISKTWTGDGTYIDAHRRGSGHDGIDAMIQIAQEHFPGYRLHLVSGIETHNNYVRFSWAAGGSPDAPPYLAGTDFAVIAIDGRLKSVTGFLDAAPAPTNQR
jgi:SnoaL-like domain